MIKIKKIIYSTLIVLCVSMLGAWAPMSYSSVEDRYANADLYSMYAVETITYDSKNVNEKVNSAPQYTALDGMTNACGAVAGAEVIAYYDKYYSEMIPGWQSYYPASGKYRPLDKVYIPSVMKELYSLMRTNVEGLGVSDSDFVNGLTKYINSKGYDVSLKNVVYGTGIDYESCKSAIDNNKVIILLSRAVNVYHISYDGTQDRISAVTISDLHIMVASGYTQIKYYNGATEFRTDQYLYCSTGLTSTKTAFYKVNPHSLNYAYIVNVN